MTWKTPVMTRLNRRRAARDGGGGGSRSVGEGLIHYSRIGRRGKRRRRKGRAPGRPREEETEGGDTGRLFVLLSPDSAACKSVCVWNNKLCVFVAWWRSFAWPAGAMRSM